jgi:hypothetical protein
MIIINKINLEIINSKIIISFNLITNLNCTRFKFEDSFIHILDNSLILFKKYILEYSKDPMSKDEIEFRIVSLLNYAIKDSINQIIESNVNSMLEIKENIFSSFTLDLRLLTPLIDSARMSALFDESILTKQSIDYSWFNIPYKSKDITQYRQTLIDCYIDCIKSTIFQLQILSIK